MCALRAAVITPFAIIIHRYILLSESARNSARVFGSLPYGRFFAYAFAINILWEVPFTLMLFANAFSSEQLYLTMALFILAILAVVLAIRVGLRTVILFPAIAVQASAADWLCAIKDSRGHTWRILFVLFWTSVPIIVLQIALSLLEPVVPPYARIAVTTVESVLLALWTGCLAAAASYLFLAYSNQLGKPPNLKPVGLVH